MEPRFTRRPDGVVDVDLGPDLLGLTETLLDAVGTRAPAGSDEDDPSTYWIDRVLVAVASGDTGRTLATGNATELVRRGSAVEARSTYDLWDPLVVPLDGLVDVLVAWRRAVAPASDDIDAPFQVELRWKEQVAYWEGRRGVLFEASWGVDPPVLHVPDAGSWDDAVPDWLRGRRDEVLGRLGDGSQHVLADEPVSEAPRPLER